ncbi:MAG: anti-sigma regulatory factor [Gammaproteobacteria bacterium]
MAADSAVCELKSEMDIVKARHMVRQFAQREGFSIVDQTKLVTAASELARNAVLHGGGGEMSLTVVRNPAQVGLRLVFTDRGRGIADLELAMKDGWTSGEGLGLGLSGAKRLCNEFSIESSVGEGTRVTIARWKTLRS